MSIQKDFPQVQTNLEFYQGSWIQNNPRVKKSLLSDFNDDSTNAVDEALKAHKNNYPSPAGSPTKLKIKKESPSKEPSFIARSYMNLPVGDLIAQRKLRLEQKHSCPNVAENKKNTFLDSEDNSNNAHHNSFELAFSRLPSHSPVKFNERKFRLLNDRSPIKNKETEEQRTATNFDKAMILINMPSNEIDLITYLTDHKKILHEAPKKKITSISRFNFDMMKEPENTSKRVHTVDLLKDMQPLSKRRKTGDEEQKIEDAKVPPPYLLSKPSKYKILNHQLDKCSFQINNLPIKTEPFGNGAFLNVLKVHANSPIIEGVSNNQLVIKFFKPKHADRPGSHTEEYMQNSIDNYNTALDLKLPCAKIYNIDTALKDGYLIQHLVPGKIDLTNKDHVDQVQKFFKVASENKYTCDLTYNNLRVENGLVTLIDFAKKKIDYRNEYQLGKLAITSLMGWGKVIRDIQGLYGLEGREETKKLLNLFTENLGYNDEWIESALDKHFQIFNYDEIFHPAMDLS